VHLSVKYSKPERIGATLWIVGRARHLGQRGRPSGTVDETGSDGASQAISPIGRPPRAGQPDGTSLVPAKTEGNLILLGPERPRLAAVYLASLPQGRHFNPPRRPQFAPRWGRHFARGSIGFSRSFQARIAGAVGASRRAWADRHPHHLRRIMPLGSQR